MFLGLEGLCIYLWLRFLAVLVGGVFVCSVRVIGASPVLFCVFSCSVAFCFVFWVGCFFLSLFLVAVG